MDPELKALLEQIKKNVESGQGESAENKEAVAKLNTEVQKLSEKFEAYQKSRAAVSVPGVDAEKFSFGKMLYAKAYGNWKHAGYEAEVLKATKDAISGQSVGVAEDGGVMVPMEVSSQIINKIKARTVLMRMGAVELPISAGVGSLRIPTAEKGTDAYWIDELHKITRSLSKFGGVTLKPHKLAGTSIFSKELLRDATAPVEQFVQNEISQSLAREIDRVGLVGLGDTQPIGIVNTQNILTYAVGDNGDESNWQLISALRLLLEMQETDAETLGLVSSPGFFAKLREQTILPFSGATDGLPVFAPIISDKALAGMLEANIGKTTLMPANRTKGTGHNLTSAILGDFSQLLYGTWGGMEFSTTTEGENFDYDSFQVKAVQRVDWGVRNPKAFAVATDVKTSLPISVDTVALQSATANGSAGSATSTKITLTFDKAVTIGASNVTIYDGSVGKATKGVVSNADAGVNKVWEVAVSSVTQGDVFLSIAGVNGVTLTGVPVSVAVYKA